MEKIENYTNELYAESHKPRKKAFLTGITGQDGSYLTEILLEKGYVVHGMVRRASTINTSRIDHLVENPEIFNKTLFLHYGDLTDSTNIDRLISEIKPDEVYNLGAQSHVKVSFEVPEYTADADALGPLRILEAMRKHCPDSKFYQASTSEMFGGLPEEMPEKGYNENSPFHPRSPYGVAKLYGHWISRNYRESYGMFIVSSCLFNHESKNRGDTFVTKKITNWCKNWHKSVSDSKQFKPLELGNLYAYRDWGHAKDFMECVYLMVQQETPEDYVIATGETYTVKDFFEECMRFYNKEIVWIGEGINEKCYVDGQLVLQINEKYFRPAEVDLLLGDSTKARNKLGWKPKYDFKSLVKDMLENDN